MPFCQYFFIYTKTTLNNWLHNVFLSLTNWEQESVFDFVLLTAKHEHLNGHWSVCNKYNDLNLTIELSRLLFDNVLMIKAGRGTDFYNTSQKCKFKETVIAENFL